MIIGICGGTSSGKTTFTRKLLERVNPDYVVHMEHDVYYRNKQDIPKNLLEVRNFDHPESLDNELFVKHLQMLQANKSIEQPIYDFTCDNRKKETKLILSKPIILVEGVLIFAIAQIRNLCNIKVYIETADDLRLARRVIRDIHERGRTPESVMNQYLTTVRPMHSQFVALSKQYADLIISGNNENYVGLDLIVTKINAQIKNLKILARKSRTLKQNQTTTAQAWQ